MNGIKTLFGFLFFRKNSIHEVASNPIYLIPGFLFVVAAGFAREYDGESLWDEPFHLAIPLVASTIACFGLTCLLWLFDIAFRIFKGTLSEKTPFLKLLIIMLNFCWMTAPLALLYGIPFERFLPEFDAIVWNLRILGIVALWRVALMIRCTSILFQANPVVTAIPVLLFSCITAFIALSLVPLPVLNIMGGIRLSEADSLLAGVTFNVMILSFLGMWIFGFFCLLTPFAGSSARWNGLSKLLENFTKKPSPPGLLYYALAVVSIILWLPFLPKTQVEQSNRYQFDQLVRQKKFVQAIQFTRGKTKKDFPPFWSPAPRIAYSENKPKFENATFYLIVNDAPEWLIQKYLLKFCSQNEFYSPDLPHLFYQSTPEELETFLKIVKARKNDGKLIAALYTFHRPNSHRNRPLINIPEDATEDSAEVRKKKIIDDLIQFSEIDWAETPQHKEILDKLKQSIFDEMEKAL